MTTNHLVVSAPAIDALPSLLPDTCMAEPLDGALVRTMRHALITDFVAYSEWRTPESFAAARLSLNDVFDAARNDLYDSNAPTAVGLARGTFTGRRGTVWLVATIIPLTNPAVYSVSLRIEYNAAAVTVLPTVNRYSVIRWRSFSLPPTSYPYELISTCEMLFVRCGLTKRADQWTVSSPRRVRR